MSRRVAVTGLGVVSALGSSKEVFWRRLTAGRSGFAKVSSFPTQGYRTEIGAEVRDLSPRSARTYALHASREALQDAGLKARRLVAGRSGVALGTTTGELLEIEKALLPWIKGRRSLTQALKAAFPHSPGAIAASVGRAFGLRGPQRVLTTACSSGNAAIAFAFDKVAQGQADLMLAGGVDVYNRINLAGFNRLLAAAPEVCAPFSKGRKGLVPGEGCAILVLEELDSARARGARIYAELLGYGVSSDGLHPTIPDAGGIARAISAALADCGLAAADVDYISAHGTGTELNDRVETAAIRAVFGPRAARVPVSSIKSMLGHAMGAASAIEAAACCLSLETGTLPPTMNHTPGDPDCDLDYVPNQSRKTGPRVILSNAFAFGGSNAVIALAKPGRRSTPEPDESRVVVTGLGSCDEADPLALAEVLLPDKDLRYLDRPMAYAACAAKRAWDDARLDPSGLGETGGVILDAMGELDSFIPFFRDLVLSGPQSLEPRLFPNVLNAAAANRVAILFGLKAVNWTFAGSFPGGESALAGAFDFLRRTGRGAVLAGGVDAGPVCRGASAGRAFLMVVEPLEEARRRGARVIAEVEGYEESSDPGAGTARRGKGSRLESWLRDPGSSGGREEISGRSPWGGTIRLRLARPS